MTYLLAKAAISAAIIVAASELAKRSPAAGAIVTALPLVSVLAMIWLWVDTRDSERLAGYAEATLFYLLPTLPMFILLPAMLRKGFGFYVSLGASVVLTALLFLVTAAVLRRFGIEL